MTDSIMKRQTRYYSALWMQIFLILFMLAVPYSEKVDGAGSGIGFLKDFFFFTIATPYMILTFSETARRGFRDLSAFLWRNGLALLALFVGAATFVAHHALGWYTLTADQWIIILNCTVLSGLDLTLGALTSLRIAGAGKERDDEMSVSP